MVLALVVPITESTEPFTSPPVRALGVRGVGGLGDERVDSVDVRDLALRVQDQFGVLL
jgi:hypothetical protein